MGAARSSCRYLGELEGGNQEADKCGSKGGLGPDSSSRLARSAMERNKTCRKDSLTS